MARADNTSAGERENEKQIKKRERNPENKNAEKLLREEEALPG